MAVLGALLAAGAARRFGAPKLLLPAGPGQTVLSRAAITLLSSVDGPVLAIVPPEASLHRAALAPLMGPRLRLVTNPHSSEGLGTSVAAAAQAALASPEAAEGLLLLPADLPRFPPSALSRMVEEFRARAPWAAAAERGGTAQAPALFCGAALPDLAGRSGAKGAQALLASPSGVLLRQKDIAEHAFDDLDRWPAYAEHARALGWFSEPLPPVLWQAQELDAGPKTLHWRLGEHVEAHWRLSAESGEILGSRGPDRITLFAGGGPREGLALLRAAALYALQIS